MNWGWLYVLAQQKPLGDANSLGIPKTKANGATLDGIIQSVFILVGAFAVFFIVYGAFQYVISRGDESRIESAKNTIYYSVIGLVIALSAFLIVEFITDRIA